MKTPREKWAHEPVIPDPPPALLAFLKALPAAWTALEVVDTAGHWIVRGKFGHIAVVDSGFQLRLTSEEQFSWSSVRRAMSAFAAVVSEADRVLRMDRLPTPDEAAVIRSRFAVRKYPPARVAPRQPSAPADNKIGDLT